MTPKPAPVKTNFRSRALARPSIGNEMHHNTTLRTQNTFIVRGYINGKWKQMRVKAPDADGARYIAHQREMHVAECEEVETKI